MKILIIEPYYGGSHKQWIDQLVNHSTHSYQVLSMTARHWKWRMEGGALELIKQIREISDLPDLIITSSMLDLSLFKVMLPQKFRDIPVLHYMHENQLTYPKSKLDTDVQNKRDFHYGFMQFKSILVADKVYFNSHYHKNEFKQAILNLLERMPDYCDPKYYVKVFKDKCDVLHLGIEFPAEFSDYLPIGSEAVKSNPQPIFLWNHRWEYDKYPELFFHTLYHLFEDGIDFKIIVLGESSGKYPAIFSEAKERLKSRIIHWGYVNNKTEYYNLLKRADFLLVTSIQEFFGISVLEAVGCGVVPILPDRLVYLEHFPKTNFQELYYESEDVVAKHVKRILSEPLDLNTKKQLIDIAKGYLWQNQITHYDQVFQSMIH